MVWSVGVMVLYLYLSRRWVPPALKYVVTAWDLLLVTTLVVLAGGPRSPLVILYFLIIAAAPLRLSIRLVYAATLLSLLAYGFLWALRFLCGRLRTLLRRSHHADSTHAGGRLCPRAHHRRRLGRSDRAPGPPADRRQRCRRRRQRADVVGPARDIEVRRDTRLVATGLVLVAVLVGLGLFFSSPRAESPWEVHRRCRSSPSSAFSS